LNAEQMKRRAGEIAGKLERGVYTTQERLAAVAILRAVAGGEVRRQVSYGYAGIGQISTITSQEGPDALVIQGGEDG
jgi:hypothetical protein